MRVEYDKARRDQADVDLASIASELDALERSGAIVDEPEGSRYVKVSDTQLRRLATLLRQGKTK